MREPSRKPRSAIISSQRLELGVVDEQQQVAGLGEVDLGGEEGGRGERLLAARGQIGERGAEQRAADAVADDVDLLDARLALDGIGGRQDALLHVVLEGLVREALVRVDPGHDEHRETLARPCSG